MKRKRKRRLALSFCRVVYVRAARRGCHCISCDWARSEKRQRRQEYGRSEKTRKKDRARLKRKMRLDPDYKAQSLARLNAWRANQDPLAKVLYDHFRWLVKRDGMWDQQREAS